MSVPVSLLAKTLGGVVAVAAPVATGVVYREDIREFLFSKETNTSSEGETKNENEESRNLNKFDQGLIDYLENGGDIQFKVVKTTDNNEEDLQASNFFLTNGSLDVVVKVKVSVNTESENTIGTLQDSRDSGQGSDNNKGKKTTLQQLNKKEESSSASDWTWICEIKFSGTGDSSSQIKEEKKNLIFKESGEGLFGILKETINNDEAKKKTKINFIKNCAEARGENTETESSNEIKTPKEKVTFEFKKEAEGTDLVPNDETKFNKWFAKQTAEVSG